MGLVCYAHQTQHLRDLFPYLSLALVQDFHGESHIFKHCLFREQAEILKYSPDLSPEFRDFPVAQSSYFFIINYYASFVSIYLFKYKLDKSGFSGSAGAYQKNKISFCNVDTNIIQPYVRTVSFGHMAKSNHVYLRLYFFLQIHYNYTTF